MKIEIKENSCIIDGIEYEKKEQPTPKDGEVWYMEFYYRWLVIMKSEKEAYLAFRLDDNQIIITLIASLFPYIEKAPKTLANDEHIALLHTKLAENGKVWNPDTKVLEDYRGLRVGELAIFWDRKVENAVIANYEIFEVDWYYASDGNCYRNAIPFESIEQYLEFIKS